MKFEKLFLNDLFDFVQQTCMLFNIDESHGLGHSMNVFYYASELFKEQSQSNEYIIKVIENIIIIASILHDMCDKKYMNETEGLLRIQQFLSTFPKYGNEEEITIILQIISTMSYSKVKENGFPTHFDKDYLLAYHIVREADLLAAYQFDRCVIYQMITKKNTYLQALNDAKELFEKRVTKHLDHQLFVTTTGKKMAEELSTKISYPAAF